MNTGVRTTYILLDRGTEDVALSQELSRVLVDLLGIMSPSDVGSRYPTLLKLKNGLLDEVRSQQETQS